MASLPLELELPLELDELSEEELLDEPSDDDEEPLLPLSEDEEDDTFGFDELPERLSVL